MQFKPSAFVLTALMSSTALAGWNCKCQTTTDKNGIQYNDRTESVCRLMQGEKRDEINDIASKSGGAAGVAALAIPGVGEIAGVVIGIVSQFAGAIFSDATYHGDQVHQCSSHSGQLDSGKFVQLCTGLAQEAGTDPGVGAYCWK